MMDVGGFILIFEAFRTALGSSSGATGETSRTAPASGLRRYHVAVGRQPTPTRHRRAPGRLGWPRGPRVARQRPRRRPVGVVAVRSARTASRGSERSTSTPSKRRVRRRAKPRLCWLQRHAVPRGATGNRASVSPPGLDATSCKHRFGFVVIDAARFTRLLSLQRMGAVLFQSARCSATFSFLSIQA